MFHATRVLARAIKEARGFFSVSNHVIQSRTIGVPVPWVHPQHGFVKLNWDGASNNLGMAGIGGVLCGDHGGFYACYAKHVFKNDNNVAEVWDIRNGMLLTRNMGLKKLEVESDSTIQLSKEEVQAPWGLRTLIQDTDALKKNFEAILFSQRYREVNVVADFQAKGAAAK
ncbi:uncharacterized protein LOC113351746 [Papaver somniferum]|uniref:uncharacterized protein LOC113351746 n=1 Tax=Papaver somniferum TaxID=3469 RepID=UPI000E6F9B53|nr:uncharacterized protein LOC113351746 [Papaver somniferum]